MAVTDTTRLGCGRDMDDVWAHVDQEPDAHERTCPDCQAARARLAGLALATREMAAADADDPVLHTSPRVIAEIVSIARAEVRRGSILPLVRVSEPDGTGRLGISEQTIAGVVRRTCDEIPGVQARRCHVRVTDPDGPALHEGSAEEPVAVTVELSASLAVGQSIPALAGVIRSRIAEALSAQVGIDVSAVHLAVEDLDDE